MKYNYFTDIKTTHSTMNSVLFNLKRIVFNFSLNFVSKNNFEDLLYYCKKVLKDILGTCKVTSQNNSFLQE